MIGWPRYVERAEAYSLREVAPGLFVGSAAALLARDESGDRYRWGSWVECAHGSYGLGSAVERLRASIAATIPHTALLSLRDCAPIAPRDLDAALLVVRAARESGDGPSLVSCASGVSRSAVVAFAMLRAEGIAHVEALRRVSSHGFDVGGYNPAGVASVEAWIATRRDRARGEREPVRA